MLAYPQLLKVDAEITSWNYTACSMQVREDDYTDLISGLKNLWIYTEDKILSR